MTQHQIHSKGLRAELRALPRGTLLLIAERAIDLATGDQLGVLLDDIVQIEVAPSDNSSDAAASTGVSSLLEEVSSFHDAAMNGEFYEHVDETVVKADVRAIFEASRGGEFVERVLALELDGKLNNS